jgi:hypothetical protein
MSGAIPPPICFNGVDRVDFPFNHTLGNQSVGLFRFAVPLSFAHFIIWLMKADPERVAVDIRIFQQNCTASSSP